MIPLGSGKGKTGQTLLAEADPLANCFHGQNARRPKRAAGTPRSLILTIRFGPIAGGAKIHLQSDG